MQFFETVKLVFIELYQITIFVTFFIKNEKDKKGKVQDGWQSSGLNF